MAAVPLCHRKSGVTEVTIIMPLSFTLTLTSIASPIAVLVFSCEHSRAGALDQRFRNFVALQPQEPSKWEK